MLYGTSEQYADDFDLIYDQCYPLHAKTTSFCFTFALVNVNPIIFD